MPKRVRKAATPRKILVPLDGSSLGEAVIGYLEQIADPSRAELVLLQVVAPVKPVGLVRAREAAAYRALADQRARAERYLEEVRTRLGRQRIRARLLVRSGEAAKEILDCAATQDVDLIAMSTHGRSGLRRVLFGSVAEAVLRKSPVPILLARAETGRKAPGRPS